MIENRTYSEADVRELRVEWERDRQQQEVVLTLRKFEGRFDSLPAQMEAVARRVVVEVLAEQRARIAEDRSRAVDRNWSRLPAVVQILQLALTVVLAAGAYLVGKSGITP